MSKRAEWWLPVLAKIWPITWKSARATRWPFIGKFVELFALPFMSETNFNVTHIPINKKINGIENLYLPERIVEELINRSSHRVAMDNCFVSAIEIVDAKAVIGKACVGCGCCLQYCKKSALSLSIDNEDELLKQLFSRVREMSGVLD